MADVNIAPKLSKNRKLGKHKKKSWRASNIDDVEEFLEDERRQIRTGGLVAEKPDESLFIIDTRAPKDSDNELVQKKRQRDKPLKCHSLLQPDPYSKTVRKPDSDNFQKGQKHQRILDRLRARSVSQTRLAALDQRNSYQHSKKTKDLKKSLDNVDTDLWSDDAEPKLKPSKKPRKKPSALPATVLPHPGASINPAYEDHQNLLLHAHIKEVEKEKKERKLYNALEGKFPSKADAPDESTYLVEMSAGLVDDSEDNDETEEEDEERPLSVNPPVRREDRKTKKQKRIKKEEEKMIKQKAKENKIKRKENMILRLPTLRSEIARAERLKKTRTAVKEKLRVQEKYKTRRLGKIKFIEPDLDLKLSDELVASLREVKPEGHILYDVYKSLQRRNIMEPGVKQKRKRKYKLKTFEKKGHKAVTL